MVAERREALFCQTSGIRYGQPQNMKKWIIRTALILLAMAVILPPGVVFAHAGFYRSKIYPGVKIANIDVGGLTAKAAEARLRARIIAPEEFTLTYGEDDWNIPFAELQPQLRADRSATEALSLGRGGGLLDDVKLRYTLWNEGATIPISWSMKAANSRPAVEKAGLAINRPAVDAKLLIDGVNIRLEPGQSGRITDATATIERVRQALLMNEATAVVAVKEWQPEQTTKALKALRIETLVAEFTTTLNPALNNRRHNIALATRKINDSYVNPGDIFSFNQLVGTRTSTNGFRTAPVISGGNLVPGIGGGICQVATTLYNAALKSGLPIMERSLHSNYISSYPAGRDATVVDGIIDLKFQNDTGGHLLLRGEVRAQDVLFRIYGPKTGRQVSFSDAVTFNYTGFSTKVTTDTALPVGSRVKDQSGVSGRTVTVTRTVRKGDKVLIDETTTSRYLPRQELLRVGPAPKPPDPTTDTTNTVSE